MTSEHHSYQVSTLLDVGAVRRAIGETLEWSGFGPRHVEDAAIMVSELMANALLHAGAPANVTMDIGQHDVAVSVDDGSSEWPVVQPPDPTTVGGNGMRIVEALSDEWGTTRRDGLGKTVWFRLRRR